VPLNSKYNKEGKLLVKGLSTIKAELGSVIYALQYMNDTSLLSAGTIFRYEDFRFYERFIFDDNKVYAERLDGTKELIKRIVIGIDLAISEKQTADYTAMVVAGKSEKGNIYILSYINQRLTFNKQLHLIESLVEKWTPNEVAIEKVAYQEALIDELKRRGGLKIMAITPTRDKVARAYLVSGLVESNLVHFKQKGMSDVTDNLTIFPDGTHDDIADAFVYTMGRLKVGSVEPIMLSL
jgi:predicted phage terminase large subunit-like protein